MGECNHCCPTCGKSLTEEQTQTNTEIVVPVHALGDYELDIASGAVPPDTTYEEWRNRPVNAASKIFERGEKA